MDGKRNQGGMIGSSSSFSSDFISPTLFYLGCPSSSLSSSKISTLYVPMILISKYDNDRSREVQKNGRVSKG